MFHLDSNAHFPKFFRNLYFEAIEEALEAASELARFSDAKIRVLDGNNHVHATFINENLNIYIQRDDHGEIQKLWLQGRAYLPEK